MALRLAAALQCRTGIPLRALENNQIRSVVKATPSRAAVSLPSAVAS